jgi:hypothetical protein
LENNSFIENFVGALVDYDIIPVEKKCEIEAVLETAFETTKEVVVSNTPVLPEIIKIVSNFRDKNLLKKIYSFLQGINSVTKEEIKTFFEKDTNNFSEKLLITIDRIDFEEKINYLSRLFEFLISNKIDEILFFKCTKALENLYHKDIIKFKEKYIKDKEYSSNDFTFECYKGVGLFEHKKSLENGKEFISLGTYIVSDVGNVFLEIIN